MLADYHHMVYFGHHIEKIAEELGYETRGLVRRLEELESLGYTVRWPQFPVPTYDDDKLRWWQKKLKNSA
ncbi:hypothetical protein AN910_04635 [Mycobacteroides immunogenum]|nr:hypothetical protein AN909_05410 [Mycobacteroides immunogenum]KPG17418.1 hypothetical protein AN910_04635 [Mycobacteroides immunogenum]KPG47327.1 hypothetical protein AN915_04090 [Mycobacteroides immunogenum]KPG47391.1 hypothetical protein AN915_04535 [Mycobacteroides immunogenum]KPG53332.1 hypothetical protein AN917_05565 [Mycobacteroides immunogenum]